MRETFLPMLINELVEYPDPDKDKALSEEILLIPASVINISVQAEQLRQSGRVPSEQ